MESTTKLVRSVAMNIREKDGADPIRINVDFDLSGLTVEQLADWCTNASSLRVNYQNKVRPKGKVYLEGLSKQTQKVKVLPCGTHSVPELSDEQMYYKLLERKLGSAEAATQFIAEYDTIAEAFIAAHAPVVKEETEQTEDHTLSNIKQGV